MAISSLTKFTVPLSSDQSASAQGLLMPKMKYRFRVTFENFGVSQPVTELTKQVVSCGRPNVTFSPVTIDVYNSKVYLAGKPEWQELSVTLRDDAGGNVSRLVGEQLQKQFDFLEQSSAAAGIDYKFVTRLEMLDGGNGVNEPNILETWEMYGCMVTTANYGEVDYGSNDQVTIDLSLRYDNAVQTPSGTGVGTFVGRALGGAITG
jgi:hypothetical protein